jgi:hypothetical protein
MLEIASYGDTHARVCLNVITGQEKWGCKWVTKANRQATFQTAQLQPNLKGCTLAKSDCKLET